MPLARTLTNTIKSVALLAVCMAITGATMRMRNAPSGSSDLEFRFAEEPSPYENDTCAYDIMIRYNCSELACTDQAGLFNYLYIQECKAEGWQKPVLIICWFTLLAFIIYILATTADKYFCVTLTDMVEKMGIPPSIAGVTFLSFGNGGPDVFALMTAVIEGHSHIGMGSNLGAGLFITTVITGVVAFMSECKVNPLSFYRDIITYIVSTIYMAIVFFDKQIKLWEIIGFLVIYLIYVLIVILFRKQSSDIYEDIEELSRVGTANVLVTQDTVDELVGTTGVSVTAKVKVMSEPMYSVRHMVKEMVIDELDDEDDVGRPILPERYASNRDINDDMPCILSGDSTASESTLPTTTTSMSSELPTTVTSEVIVEPTTIPAPAPALTTSTSSVDSEKVSLLEIVNKPEPEKTAKQSVPLQMLSCSIQKEKAYYAKQPWYWKIVYWLEAPLTILRNTTIPVVMEERYNKWNLLLTSFGMPLFLFYKSEKALTDVVCGMPLWAILAIAIPALFLFFYFFAPWEKTPSGWMFFVVLFISFFMSIMWVEEIADELVSLMNALGCIAGIQPFVMGLTILAVGNSISDLIGDMTITKQGYPQMAIGGIYASPMFSLLVGLGVALGIRYAENPSEPLTLGEDTEVINLTFVFMLITLVVTLIVVPLQKYTYTKKFGVFLIGLYLVSMLMNVLAAMDILRIPFLMPKVE